MDSYIFSRTPTSFDASKYAVASVKYFFYILSQDITPAGLDVLIFAFKFAVKQRSKSLMRSYVRRLYQDMVNIRFKKKWIILSCILISKTKLIKLKNCHKGITFSLNLWCAI